MIKKLRIKFTAITMSIVFVLLIFILGSIVITMNRSGALESRDILRSIVNEGAFQKQNGLAQGGAGDREFRNDEKKPQRKGGAPIFAITATVGNGGEIIKITQSHEVLDEDDAYELIEEIMEDERTEGKLDGYMFLKAEKTTGTVIAIIDRGAENDMMRGLVMRSSLIGVLGFIAIFIIVIFLSKWATKPVEEAFLKQKQFIADASHEFKTPLAVISTNAKVLEGEIGHNKWLMYICEQTERMRELTVGLLSLARAEEENAKKGFSQFDLSRAVNNSALSFESVAFEAGKSLALDIDDNIYFTGDESEVKQLSAILIDNAIKHSTHASEIKISLKPRGKKAVLEVFNKGNSIEPDEQKRIFERFYKADRSRTRDNGGYGLGLPIAKAITESMGGNISVRNSDGGVVFSVVL